MQIVCYDYLLSQGRFYICKPQSGLLSQGTPCLHPNLTKKNNYFFRVFLINCSVVKVESESLTIWRILE